ncbi:MAG TPA: FAD-dependent cmnm(5)s(2)U34 oxidoreductase [Hyphomonas atlantica]|uniref:tRNA 5-methylaminomethyl-2-thiouridine biosynthesis bifunctional protein MnmC n=1 Tax=Hyphomonas atlantica TaxID=1280948 RepID=A0A356W742_9PROT|nr:FAD-dependent cmnm(5)s(2)U34 oxidoreductase [Hyphomonas atlantica]
MTRLLTHPTIDWKDDGTPVAREAGDVYFTAGDGLAETRAVFLKGCGLPEAWTGRDEFTIAETGFGTGLNFLALCELWQANRPHPDAWLHFVSFEGFPLTRDDAARALNIWPELKPYADRLLAAWPGPIRRVHHEVWQDLGITLTLHLGDIHDTLPQSEFQADAWFLDGFSPAKNEDMWAAELYGRIAARSKPGAVIGTFTVAGAVRRGLADEGFNVAKAQGHGRKRERLEATLLNAPTPAQDVYGLRGSASTAKRIAILGAGIASASAAHALSVRGANVTVFDPAGIASGASGNPLALLMPRLDAGDTVQARLLIDAYLAARQTYSGMDGAHETSVRQMPKDTAELSRFAKLLADPPLPLEDLEAISGGGLLHKRAMILEPQKIVASLLGGVRVPIGTVNIDLRNRTVNGETFDAIIMANAMSAIQQFDWLKLEGRLGQVEFATGATRVEADALASGHYALALNDERLWGATFEKIPQDADATTSDTAREDNAEALKKLSPWWRRDAKDHQVTSRAAIRATTADRLPLIGAVPNLEAMLEAFSGLRTGRAAEADAPLLPGIFLVNGFGARGFTWGPWAGRILAAMCLGGPVAAEVSALEAISPSRLILRALKRGEI